MPASRGARGQTAAVYLGVLFTVLEPPERWPVVTERADALDPDFWATELLVALYTRQVTPGHFAGRLPDGRPSFTAL